MEELFQDLADKLLDKDVREGKLEYIEESREKAEHLEWHFDDDYPEKLLYSNHPGEEPWMKAYRKLRWQAPSKIATGRVFTFLQKIQQADDFKIRYETETAKTGIVEEVQGVPNTLKAYMLEQFPKYRNAETWLFNTFLKTYLQDANAWVLVWPDYMGFVKEPDLYQPDFTQPYFHIIESEDMVFESEEAIIWKTKSWKDREKKKWDQFLGITKFGLVLFRQIAAYDKASVQSVFQIYTAPFEFQYLPAIKVGNVVYEEEEGRIVYDSVLAPCLPAWNEMLFAADDLAVLDATTAIPKMWRVGNSPCKTCKGTGQVRQGSDKTMRTCGTCNGSGHTTEDGPFTYINLNIEKASPNNPNPTPPPTPPAGYLERPIDSNKYFQEKMEYKEFQGLKAIGLEILGQIPANQSGIAKEYDRKELNTFCFSVCYHLSEIYKQSCYHILFQRYNSLFASQLINSDQVKANIPNITVPTDFDVLTAAMIGDMLAQAKDKQFNSIIVYGIESDYVEKLYGADSFQHKMLKIQSILDPLPFKSMDEKALIKDAGGCSELDFILSCNLAGFVAELSGSNPNWWMEDIAKQKADVIRLAQAKQQAIRSGLIPLIDEG